MRLGVQIRRRSYLKALAPILVAAYDEGHDVTILDDPSHKYGERLKPRDLFPFRDILVTRKIPELDVVVGMDPERLAEYPAKQRVYVGEFYDNLLWKPRADLIECAVSAYHADLRWRRWAVTKSPPDPIVGWTLGDHLARCVPSTTRQRDGLPSDRPIWVFFSAKRHPIGYASIVRAIRQRARADGAYLVGLTRKKSRDPWWLQWCVDQMIRAEEWWPYTAMQLIACASLVIHFESGAGLEAAWCGVPSVSIQTLKPSVLTDMGDYYATTPQTRLHWLGVTESVSMLHAPRYFKSSRMPELSPSECSAYCEKFLGERGNAAKRVLEICQQ